MMRVREGISMLERLILIQWRPSSNLRRYNYGVDMGRKKKTVVKKDGEETDATATEEVKKSNHVQRKVVKLQEERKVDPHLEEELRTGRLLAAISLRPGQCGRSDGYILEGKELEFYMKKIQKKKGKDAGGA